MSEPPAASLLVDVVALARARVVAHDQDVEWLAVALVDLLRPVIAEGSGHVVDVEVAVEVAVEEDDAERGDQRQHHTCWPASPGRRCACAWSSPCAWAQERPLRGSTDLPRLRPQLSFREPMRGASRGASPRNLRETARSHRTAGPSTIRSRGRCRRPAAHPPTTTRRGCESRRRGRPRAGGPARVDRVGRQLLAQRLVLAGALEQLLRLRQPEHVVVVVVLPGNGDELDLVETGAAQLEGEVAEGLHAVQALTHVERLGGCVEELDQLVDAGERALGRRPG